MKKDGGSAFPYVEGANQDYVTNGMTLRDYFAATERYTDSDHQDFTMAQKEKMMGRPCPTGFDDALERAIWWWQFKAKIRYMKADAMIAEREK